MIVLQCIFWISVLVIIHSYALYPLVLFLLTKNKSENTVVYDMDDSLPKIAVLLAVYNEESVIEEKIKSILRTTYPLQLIEVYIGSDKSSDGTDDIVKKYSESNPNIHLIRFDERTGKPQIINKLTELTTAEILLLTDANVYFEENTIFELVKHFKNNKIQAVGSLIKNNNEKSSGISVQEKAYLMQDSAVKYRESLWGRTVIGLFGGLYAIRKLAYCPVPKGFLVDDFYITMKVIENHGEVITTNDSVCYEDVSNNISDEFNRKVRISSGNFKNLVTFRKLTNPFTKVGFMFLSHKVFRWFTPFLLIVLFVVNLFLWNVGMIYQITLCGQIFLLLLIVMESILRKFNVHCKLFRFVTHFYAMNLALFVGFWKYVKDDSTNVWQPTKRNQA